MANLLTASIFDSETRYQYTKLARALLILSWKAVPKRGAKYYGVGLLILSLWIAPKAIEENTGKPIKAPVGLFTSLVALAGAGVLSSKLEDYHDDLTAERVNKLTLAAESEAVSETVRRLELQAQADVHTYDVAKAVPELIGKKYLKRFEDADDINRAEGDQMANSLIANMDRPSNRGELPATDVAASDTPAIAPTSDTPGYTGSAGLSIAPSASAAYSYSTVIIRGKQCLGIDLMGHDSFCGMPIIDLAKAIAMDDKTCFVIGITGAGKSGLLARTISWAHQLKPMTDCDLITHKSPNKAGGETFDYAGVEETQDYVIVAGEAAEPDEIIQEVDDLKWFCRQVKNHIKDGCPPDAPALEVIDEFGNGLNAITSLGYAADACEGVSIDTEQLATVYKLAVRRMMTQGNSNHVRGLITSHASINEELAMTVAQKRNSRWVFLGRGMELDAVEYALDAKQKMMSTNEVRELTALLEQYKQAFRAMRSPENVVLALTNVGDQGWRLVIVSQDISAPKITFTAQNPPIGSIGFTSDDEFNFSDAEPTEIEPDTIEDEVSNSTPSDRIDIESTRAQLDKLFELPDNLPSEVVETHPEATEANEINDNELIGGDAPAWMTYGDFCYLLSRFQSCLKTADGDTVSRFRNQCKPYRDKSQTERFNEALSFMISQKIVAVESSETPRIYYLGIDHLQ